MTRVSLKEAYNNRDVVAQIYTIRGTAESAEDSAENAVQTANQAVGSVESTIQIAEQAVETANLASQQATEASASAQASAQTVVGYENRVTALENGTVKLAGTQTVPGVKTFTEAKTTTRVYASANVNDIVTIGSLASNPSVIHATGNETKSGDLTLTNLLYVKNGNVDMKTAPSGYQSIKDIIVTQDKEGEMIMRLRRDRDVSYDRVLFTNRYYDRTAQAWNTCELLLQAVGNTVELILKKTVNGTSTQTTVARL